MYSGGNRQVRANTASESGVPGFAGVSQRSTLGAAGVCSNAQGPVERGRIVNYAPVCSATSVTAGLRSLPVAYRGAIRCAADPGTR